MKEEELNWRIDLSLKDSEKDNLIEADELLKENETWR